MSQLVLLITVSTFCVLVSSLPTGETPQVDPSIILAPFSNAQDITRNTIKQVINSKSLQVVSSFPDSGRQRAVLEFERPLSKVETAYGHLHELVGLISQPKSVVDTIEDESEKYGNDGGKIRSTGIAFIAGVEGVSNLLNAAVDIPFETAKQVARKLTDTGSAVGGKLFIAGL